ncbi:chemotaxis protein CheB [Thiospirochaeta perfilievii]|uniref:protein-glutamate methylesterase n=1 Tax=Thiospirochaeta perfilievii TaxID=252967 RepID=A0A5C1QD84_9SPIO|nr:chemotaxis protein CheB [Thiospirochaeta perfilievii]QEN04929.1 chemotaxis protein CheB [Thiospirochaeta perfilievii]
MAKYDVIVVGASAGGLSALEKILSGLEKDFSIPIIIVQHLSPDSGDSILSLLKKYSVIELSEPCDKEVILNNHVYLAPADYHIMVEKDKTFSLILGPKENYCRPAIDVLFETAAEVFFDKTLGILLTGANTDGTKGCIAIKKFSGTVIVQDPEEATMAVMPLGAINANAADFVLSLKEIVEKLNFYIKES